MGQHILVDGYNVIRKDPTLRIHEERSLEHGREELLRRLEYAPLYKQDRITVVFDGRFGGKPQRYTEHRGRIRIIYSRHGERADDVIIQLIMQATDTTQLVVMSNDRAIGLAAKIAGCQVISKPNPETQKDIPANGTNEPKVEYDDMYRKRVDYEPEPVIVKKGASFHPKKKERQTPRDTWTL